MTGTFLGRGVATAALSLLALTSAAQPALAQSSFGGGAAGAPAVSQQTLSAPGTTDATDAGAATQGGTPSQPVTSPAVRCLPVGFSAGWELAHDSAGNIDRYMRAARDAGSSHVRFVIDWSEVEATRGRYDWSRPDRVIQAASAQGLEVVASIAYTPGWARAADGDAGSSHTRPADPAAFARFAKDSAERYRQVDVFEIWNEPNLVQFWGPRPDTRQYTDLLRASYPAIRSVRPDAQVLAGAMAASGSDGANVPGPTFTTGMYAAGARGFFDAVSFHPYNYPSRLGEGSWDTLGMSDRIHATMTSNGDGAKKVWFTEFGAPTGTGSRSSSETAQGQIVASGLDTAAGRSYVGGFLAYTLKDFGNNAYDMEQNFGLLRSDFSPKAGLPTVTAAMTAHRC